jgi:hypothetical protein
MVRRLKVVHHGVNRAPSVKGGSLAFELVPADLDISRLTDSNAKLNVGYIMC